MHPTLNAMLNTPALLITTASETGAVAGDLLPSALCLLQCTECTLIVLYTT